MKKKSYAKINLILDVIEKRQDGYHNIDGIMQMIDLYDEVEVKISDKFEITSNSKDIPLDEKNLVYKVYKALKEKYKFNERFSILIEKNIPVSAGIAGGSTNSAVVIEMIDEILGLNMSLDDKKQIGKSVGADIPYLLVGKTARTRGIGDELEILDSLPTTDILIVNNGVEIATPYVYSNIVPSGNSDRIDKLINVYKNKNYDEFFKGLYNVMEKVSISYCPEIQNIKDKMYEFNCIKSLMSGSGPTVFGIFNDDKDIKKAYDYFKKIYKNTFIVKTMER
ncbi:MULTISPECIES: 4-(cytidine 5'-diphospho)-2-C-methyl-D-erythritol kinase [Parvimonas]|uniref:4-diphosphocytidyl-2-C-methyl-D-erythritol kinase n=2 Tax=Parvimonas micra TaxID=33033 RepID=A0AAX3K7N3_9FIRM|nr:MULTISPECIES: 4-(cytidine 5'-diphospho)-2-C-methyl-D-erythritol kinase [Parvimonas]AXU10831.1 4-(cytidine 5'-diphospho)-2-C-methyl-D-erythritol kinase [Parvimonas micra]EDP24394.1 4-(cytidine 5'-diphospho)-2-C-methyl-D-erythritol kinase [Parvimonas micra ATCC 33270]MCK6130885.1 4-(cytidine 5'-diphospho)-2-C-methyl-D-erythritol kinase [Parvimonas micra]MCK6136530.1 4-(cytidine 5'-diphospho)-2-C-methyl-D-erythritol kinase [Parvimonas micra]MCK6138001.1 4-(cytidine 5'-diphospho)-2-C-methyl-D-e